MTMKRATFHSYVELRKSIIITIDDETTLKAEEVRSIFLQLKQQHDDQIVKLKNTLHVSEISHNLLSANRVVREDSTIIFAASECSIIKKREVIIKTLNRNDV